MFVASITNEINSNYFSSKKLQINIKIPILKDESVCFTFFPIKHYFKH